MVRIKNAVKTGLRFVRCQTKLVLGIAAGLMLGGASTAVVMASIPDANGVIHACYTTLTGTVRIIDSPSASCLGTETAISWDQSASPLRSNLVGANFTNAVMPYWDLTNLNLSDAVFAGANLSNVDLTGATLDGADFAHAQLHNVDLSGHDLSDVELHDAWLTGTNLSNTSLPTGKNFSGAHFGNTNFGTTDLSGNNFSSASFVDQDLSDRDLTDVDLSYASISSDSVFDEVNLNGANFYCTRIANSSFVDATLTGLNWDVSCSGLDAVNSDFTDADFTGSSFNHLDFRGSTLTDTTLTDTTWTDVYCPDGTYSDDNGNTCIGHLAP
jgi:uncharacterized protein YjbI with pentapeptide repeats